MTERAPTDAVGETRRLLEFLRTPVALLLLDLESALATLDHVGSSKNLDAANASLRAAHDTLDYLKRGAALLASDGDAENIHPANATPRRARVLLVVDDAETRDHVSRVLYDCEVVPLHDPTAASIRSAGCHVPNGS